MKKNIQFSRTMGCGICMSRCPFSLGNGVYEKLKEKTLYSKIESVG